MLSLRLTTVAKDSPLSFLDHLRTGDSLSSGIPSRIGCRVSRSGTVDTGFARKHRRGEREG